MVLARVQACLRAGRVDEAIRLATGALAGGVEHPLILHLAADGRRAAGDPNGAIDLLERAVRLAPRAGGLHMALGVVRLEAGRSHEAIESFDAVLRLQPHDAGALYHRGLAFERLGQATAARRDWEASADAAPGVREPLLALAALEGRIGEPARARRWAERALALAPDDTQAQLSLAAAEVAERDWTAAAARLDALLTDPAVEGGRRALALSLRGDALAGLRRPAEAFAAYTAANDLWAARLSAQGGPAESALDRVWRLHTHFAAQLLGAAAVADRAGEDQPPAPVRRHVFLMGFPRSGTTLLEQVLANHPEVQSLEEAATLTAAAEDFLSDEAGLKRLAALAPAQAGAIRRAYWRDVAAGLGGSPRAAVFIDKLPLHVVRLPLIARLFPNAQVLFARRDPRDVVLSCFRQRFRLNRAMAEFLNLERTALYYDAVMRFADLCLPRSGLKVHEVRYEAVVTDFRPTITATLEVLGLDWSPAVEGFAAAQEASAINTPSAQQVRQGLYTAGMGQWRAFAAELEPVEGILAPWVERYGHAGSTG